MHNPTPKQSSARLGILRLKNVECSSGIDRLGGI